MLLSVVGGLFAIVLGLAAYEAATYAVSTEASARGVARQDFLRECARRGFDPAEFRGAPANQFARDDLWVRLEEAVERRADCHDG